MKSLKVKGPLLTKTILLRVHITKTSNISRLSFNSTLMKQTYRHCIRASRESGLMASTAVLLIDIHLYTDIYPLLPLASPFTIAMYRNTDRSIR